MGKEQNPSLFSPSEYSVITLPSFYDQVKQETVDSRDFRISQK